MILREKSQKEKEKEKKTEVQTALFLYSRIPVLFIFQSHKLLVLGSQTFVISLYANIVFKSSINKFYSHFLNKNFDFSFQHTTFQMICRILIHNAKELRYRF